MLPHALTDVLGRGALGHATLVVGGTLPAWEAVAGAVQAALSVAPADTRFLADVPKIAELRQLLGHIYLKPNQSPYTLTSLTAVDHWPPEVANALLKTLEEPPPHARFLMFAADASAVLPTIRSRSATFRLTTESVSATLPSLPELAAGPLVAQFAETSRLAEAHGVRPVLEDWLRSAPDATTQRRLLDWLERAGDRPVNKRLLLDTIALEYRVAHVR